MQEVAPETIALLRYLLPGFLAAWVFLGLTAHEKPNQFERVIQALIFTLFVQAGIATVVSFGWIKLDETSFATFGGTIDILAVGVAIVVGVIFALLANRSWLHTVLRRIGITQQTAYPSEWFGVFRTHRTYVVLHFHDDRRLYGWATEWPQSSKAGHFLLEQASWLVDEEDQRYLPSAGVEGILIDVTEVRWIEFMENPDGKKSKFTTAAAKLRAWWEGGLE